jgi:hypothetical protein
MVGSIAGFCLLICPRNISPNAGLLFFITYFPPLPCWLLGSLLKWKAAKLRKETGNERYIAPIELTKRSILYTVLHSIYRPMLLLALEPMCLNLCIFSAILLGILYLFFGAFQLVYSNVYGFSLWQIGCSFLGLLVGMILAVLTDPFWRRNYARLQRNHEQAVGRKNEYIPEWRLPPGMR